MEEENQTLEILTLREALIRDEFIIPLPKGKNKKEAIEEYLDKHKPSDYRPKLIAVKSGETEYLFSDFAGTDDENKLYHGDLFSGYAAHDEFLQCLKVGKEEYQKRKNELRDECFEMVGKVNNLAKECFDKGYSQSDYEKLLVTEESRIYDYGIKELKHFIIDRKYELLRYQALIESEGKSTRNLLLRSERDKEIRSINLD